jgi:short subunit dehydrogenase-like uncharacterized protein
MIYGANGYTGALTARAAVKRGMRPVLAGRNDSEIRKLAEELGLEYRVFGLDQQAGIRAAIDGMRLVLHCAGPFSLTSGPMVSACLSARAHYLDITGEIDVFASVHRLHEAGRRADVVLLPGAGFDVVPSDCLAASLVAALPAAMRLQLAFEASGGPSPGTAKTSIEGLAGGGRVRKEGRIESVPLAWKTREVEFAHARRTVVTIPWGDVYTAYVSTGVPDIEVYISVPPARIASLKRLRWLQPVLGMEAVQSFLKSRVEKTISGPSDQARESSRSQLWGEAVSADGRHVSATMTTPNGYDLTVDASLGIAAFLLENKVEGGYFTPSLLMGADYAASLKGVDFNLKASG